MKTIISIILLAASIGFFVFFTKPKWSELKVNKLEVEKLNVAQQNAKKLKLRIDGLLNEKNAIPESNLEKVKKMVPDNVENVRLIIDFDNILQEMITQNGTAAIYKSQSPTSVSDKFSIEAPLIVESFAPIDDLSFDTSQIGVADFSFVVSLTYSDFMDFLKRIESSIRIFDVESITFSAPVSSSVKNPNEIVYTFNILLKTYWLKSK